MKQYPDSQNSLSRWYKIVERVEFSGLGELRQTFPSADKIGDLLVVDGIKGETAINPG